MAAALVRVVSVANRGTGRFFGTTVGLGRLVAPLGPMPNENIDVSNLEKLEKYRSYTRYFKAAEQENKKKHWWKTCKQYLTQDQDEEAKIDIGLPYVPQQWKKIKERKQIMKQNHQNRELERAAHLRTLLIPLDEVKADWERASGPYHMRRVAEHYGIYRDLFNEAFFIPSVFLRVAYSQNEECIMPVYHGNVVAASEASSPPHVTYEAEEGSLWTLLLTNPDGHLRETEAEYMHWLVGNIPGNQVTSGEEVCHYFPPFPAKGTGYHRFIFILFKQDRPIDFGADLRPVPCHSLKMRTFKTLDFYRKHEDNMTPAGLAFFQCKWEDCVTQIFHHLLDMKEPVFEFDRPPVYHPPQKKYPHLEPLRYLDRYRDTNEPTYGIY